MIVEIIAALLVGMVALGIVLEPMLTRPRARSVLTEVTDPDETPRGIALAALREIEFDRETGKLSDHDYAELKARYTAAAVEAMRAEERVRAPVKDEAQEGSDPVEAIIAAKVRALRSASTPAEPDHPTCPSCGPRPEPGARFCSDCGRRLPAEAACAACGAALPHGARFCESCGHRQGAAPGMRAAG